VVLTILATFSQNPPWIHYRFIVASYIAINKTLRKGEEKQRAERRSGAEGVAPLPLQAYGAVVTSRK
jgi:hypothetical protein